MLQINIRLNVRPPNGTAQQRKISFRSKRTYMPKRVAETMKTFVDLLLPYAPDTPLSAPLKVVQRWYYPCPKSRLKKSSTIQPKATAGDADNIAKLLNDACTRAGIWSDDRLIYSLTIEKYYVNPELYEPGIELEITAQEEGDLYAREADKLSRA